ncbi:MAG TPA: CvpA family protein [Pseudomonadales bacterium]|nr:CvpA family protein [Pseudomonadales bacterium]
MMNESLAQLGFNGADWAIVVVVLLSVLISLVRGFVKEALSLLVWIAAFVVAFFFSERLAPLLGNLIELPSIRYLAAFAILFVLTLIVGSLVNFLIVQLVKMTGLSAIDRLLGMMFGMCRGVLICLLILIFLPKIVPVQQDPWWQQSRLIPRVLVLENWSRETAGTITGWGKQQLDKKSEFVEKVQSERQLHQAP